MKTRRPSIESGIRFNRESPFAPRCQAFFPLSMTPGLAGSTTTGKLVDCTGRELSNYPNGFGTGVATTPTVTFPYGGGCYGIKATDNNSRYWYYIPNSALLAKSINAQGTLAIWFYLSTGTGLNFFPIYLYTSSSDQFYLQMYISSGTGYANTVCNKLTHAQSSGWTIGGWNHIVFTWKNGVPMKHYNKGRLHYTSGNNYATPATSGPATRYYGRAEIGSSSSGSQIATADMAIWNYEFSAAQVAAYYADPFTLYADPTPKIYDAVAAASPGSALAFAPMMGCGA